MGIHNSSLIEAGAEIDASATIGAFVRVPAQTRIAAGVVIEDAVLFANGQPDAPTLIEPLVHVGAGAILKQGIRIGEGAQVKPGAVVLDSVPPHAIVHGNPAAIIGYVDVKPNVALSRSTTGADPVGVGGVTLHKFPVFSDIRGSLTVGEFIKDIPFTPQRYFMCFDVPSRETRGEHAHKECHQFLICLNGSCAVVVDDGTSRTEVTLQGPDQGLYLPPLTWGIQYKYSPGATLLVFASHLYDSDDYIRDYAEFQAFVQGRGA